MEKIRGRILVILLSSTLFAAGCTSVDRVKDDEKPSPAVAVVSVVAEKPEPVIREVPKIVFRYRPLKEFVIGHYPIDVSQLRGRTKSDFDRMVQELEALGPDVSHKMVIAGFASEEAPDLYNFRLGKKRAAVVRNALLKIFPDAKIDAYTDGEEHNIRQVKVYYGVLCDDISAKYLRPSGDSFILCDSVTFKVNPLIVTMTINLRQNDIELEPGEKIRAHAMTRNHRFGHEDDVVAIGELTGDGKLVFKFDNLVASASAGSYVERIWFSSSKGGWFGPPCSEFLEPDNNGHLAIQATISSDSAEPIKTDQFLDRATRSGTPSYVYREKKEEYYEN